MEKGLNVCYLTPSCLAKTEFISQLSPEMGEGFPTSSNTLVLSFSKYLFLYNPIVLCQVLSRCWVYSQKEGGPAAAALAF